MAARARPGAPVVAEAAGKGPLGAVETAESRPDLRPLIFPRSAALIGVSKRTAPEVLDNVTAKGIPVVAVHPRETAVGGLERFAGIGDVPFTPELAFLLVGHGRIEAVFDEALAAGVRAFVVPGLGNEAGANGADVAARLSKRARDSDATVVGPNCMGVAVPGGASFWIGTVPPTFLPGHVSVMVQSGSIGEALLAMGPRVGFRCVISSGGEAVTDVADYCRFFAGDGGTQAVGLFLEAVRRPAEFAASLELLARADKPVVCLKVGRSPGGARAVLAHSGAVVGSDEAFGAMLRGYGVIEVDDYPEFVEVLEVLGRRRRPAGRRVGAVSNSGGEGALLADHAEAAGIPFQPLSAELSGRLAAKFPNFLAPQNPVDAWAIDDVEKVFPGTLQLLAGSGEMDILLAQVDQSQFLGEPEVENAVLITRALADAVEGTDIFPAVASVQACDPTPSVAQLARERDVAMLRGSRNAMRALGAVAGWKPRHPPARDGATPIDLAGMLTAGTLSEFESGAILERYGIPVGPRRRASNPDEAARAAAALGFPVVVKREGPPHKSRNGGVVLGLSDEASVSRAAGTLGAPLLVAVQLSGTMEVFCGMTRDPDYGPVLAVGLGGTAVEKMPGVRSCIAPIGLDEARRLVLDAPVISRIASSAAIDAIAGILVTLGRLAVEHPNIAAVDINPLIVDADSATAVDALVIVDGDSR
jgi:acyl-CoA synthetase (NDP forming)